MRVFVGWDSRFPEPARVLALSMRMRSSVPLDIRYLDLRHLRECYGFRREHDPLQSTEFTYTRFLVPWLCAFSGKALFVDNDMLCLGDLNEVLSLDMNGLALRVVKHDHNPVRIVKMYGCVQTSYPRKNWSSLMLMDCTRLECWSKHVVQTATGARLHRFEDIPDEQVGNLPQEWNDLDHLGPGTKMIHYTSGGPWYPEYEDCPGAGLWRSHRKYLLDTDDLADTQEGVLLP